MKILKFGGSSLATADNISKVVDIVRAARRQGPVIVVVSAMGGVTDGLHAAARQSIAGTPVDCENIERRHTDCIARLVSDDERESVSAVTHELMTELRDILRGVALVRECTHRTMDLVLSYGERLCANVLSAALRSHGEEATMWDARRFIRTDVRHGSARVATDATYDLIRASLTPVTAIPVVTGFIGSTEDGETTTLGRGGSDYTASLLGAALHADEIEIWTDVDGVMSVDPRVIPTASRLDRLTYDELMELSHFGAKIVYPPTVHPARSAGVPLRIRNTFNPAFPGTRIADDVSVGSNPVRGISAINDVVMLRLEGDGMVGVSGIAARLFGVLAKSHTNVILISQASSEHSICFAVSPETVGDAIQGIQQEFALERHAGLMEDLVVEEHLAVIAAVGEGMRERPGIAGRLFAALGSAGVNVRAIAQGSSELNISFVVAQSDRDSAMRAIHHEFFAAVSAV